MLKLHTFGITSASYNLFETVEECVAAMLQESKAAPDGILLKTCCQSDCVYTNYDYLHPRVPHRDSDRGDARKICIRSVWPIVRGFLNDKIQKNTSYLRTCKSLHRSSQFQSLATTQALSLVKMFSFLDINASAFTGERMARKPNNNNNHMQMKIHSAKLRSALGYVSASFWLIYWRLIGFQGA